MPQFPVYFGKLPGVLYIQLFNVLFFEYEQNEMPGPPFAVFREELDSLFGKQFSVTSLHGRSLFEELTNFHRRGLHSYLKEKIYHLSPKG